MTVPWEEIDKKIEKREFRHNGSWTYQDYYDRQIFIITKHRLQEMYGDICRNGDILLGFYLSPEAPCADTINVYTWGDMNSQININPGEFKYCFYGTHVVSLINNSWHKIHVTAKIDQHVYVIYGLFNDRLRRELVQQNLYYNLQDGLYRGSGFKKVLQMGDLSTIIPDMRQYNKEYNCKKIQKAAADWIDLPKTRDNKLGIALRIGLGQN